MENEVFMKSKTPNTHCSMPRTHRGPYWPCSKNMRTTFLFPSQPCLNPLQYPYPLLPFCQWPHQLSLTSNLSALYITSCPTFPHSLTASFPSQFPASSPSSSSHQILSLTLRVPRATVARKISGTGVCCATSSQKRVPQNSACASQGYETGQ